MTQVMETRPLAKLWGENRHVFAGSDFSIHHATIKAGGFSSRHCHECKYNLFYVVGGRLLVHFYATPEETEPCRVAGMGPGDRMVMAPGDWHRFEAETDVELVELYYVHIVEADIVRADEGGLKVKEQA